MTEKEREFYTSPGPFTSDIEANEVLEDQRSGTGNIQEIMSGLVRHEAFSLDLQPPDTVFLEPEGSYPR